MGDISNKVVAGTVGAGVGNSVADIFVWWLTQFEHITVPDAISSAFAILFTALVTFLAGYFTPHGKNGA